MAARQAFEEYALHPDREREAIWSAAGIAHLAFGERRLLAKYLADTFAEVLYVKDTNLVCLDNLRGFQGELRLKRTPNFCV